MLEEEKYSVDLLQWPPPYMRGSIVRFKNLKQKPELNGLLATVSKYFDK